MLGWGFLIFLLFFLKFSCPGRVWTELGTKIFFFSFSVYLIPFWLKIMLGRGFLVFWIFLRFFSEFSCPRRLWTEFDTKILFSPSRLMSYRLAKNIAEKRFYIFWIFFLFFSEFSCPERGWTELETKFFFFSFAAYLILFWQKIMPGRGYLIFVLFFWEYSFPVRVWTKFGAKIFFSLLRSISSRFG